MEITEAQFKRIAPLLPRQRGKVSVPNLQVLDAILHVAEQGCKWRGLPKRSGNWHTICTRMSRRARSGVLDRVFEQHQRQGAPGRHGGSKRNGPQSIGRSRGGWNTKIHMVAADARTAVAFTLSPGNAHDAPQGRKLMSRLERPVDATARVMDKAHEDNATRQVARDPGVDPVVPPRSSRIDPREYNRQMDKRRNEVERLFRRLKGFRRIFSRFEKLDVMFLGFIVFALIVEALR